MKRSLQFRLSAWLSLVILTVALVAGVFSFVSAFQEAIELQDDQLRQIVALVNRQNLSASAAQSRERVAASDPESRVVIQLLAPPGSSAVALAGDLPGLPPNLPNGIQTVRVHDQSWRLMVETLDSGARLAVGQRTTARDEIARDGALRTLLPLLILIPILLLLVGDLIRKMIKPLKQMALDLDRRSEQDLREISEVRLPAEIHPLVVAFNRLLSRVAESVATQRRFLADAAHELRSPLTALSLQAERLEAAEMSAQATERLTILHSGIQRTRRLLDQLLTLAHAQEPSHELPQTVSIQAIFRQVLEDLMPLAEAKKIDLGVTSEDDAKVVAQEFDLKTLFKNLLGNAIRYTPEGGRIDLSIYVHAPDVVVRIDDTGPGIPPEERVRVFDPFYRVLGNDEMGSGLGLSIVQTIADRIGATVSLDDANQQTKSGLCVRVVFKVAPNR